MRSRRPPMLLSWVLSGTSLLLWSGCEGDRPKEFVRPTPVMTFKPKDLADSLHALISAEREVYARLIVERLASEQKVVAVSEQWREQHALPVPCQVLRLCSETAATKGVEFAFTIRSLWPISTKGQPETETEQRGLKFVAEHPDEPFYADERLGGRHYFTAIYPDKAIASSCVTCHNAHPQSARKDFKLGDVMGGIVVRVALEL